MADSVLVRGSEKKVAVRFPTTVIKIVGNGKPFRPWDMGCCRNVSIAIQELKKTDRVDHASAGIDKIAKGSSLVELHGTFPEKGSDSIQKHPLRVPLVGKGG